MVLPYVWPHAISQLHENKETDEELTLSCNHPHVVVLALLLTSSDHWLVNDTKAAIVAAIHGELSLGEGSLRRHHKLRIT